MKEMTWKSRLNRLFAHRFALAGAVLVRGAGVLAGAGCGGLCGGQLRQGQKAP